MQFIKVSTGLLCPLTFFLEKLLYLANSSFRKDSLCSSIFTSLAIENVYNTSIVQQCKMLVSQLWTNIVAKCLHNPENATSFVQSSKKDMYLKKRKWGTPVWVTFTPSFNQLLQCHHPGDSSGTWPLIEELKELIACNFYSRNRAGHALEQACTMWPHCKCRNKLLWTRLWTSSQFCSWTRYSEAVVTLLYKRGFIWLYFFCYQLYIRLQFLVVLLFLLSTTYCCILYNADASPRCSTWTFKILTATPVQKEKVRELARS